MHLILVVDDDEAMRSSLKDVLEMFGYSAAMAADGREALDYIRTNPSPCLILLDLTMPSMNGWDFRKYQKGDPHLAHIPTVVISGTERDQIGDGLDVEDYIQKPVDPGLLLEIVGRYC